MISRRHLLQLGGLTALGAALLAGIRVGFFGDRGEIEAVGEIDRVVHDPGLAREIAEHNFELGKQHFSYDVLEEKLTPLFAF